MPKIHYFQRYTSKENVVTNNTLQLLARIYSYSPPRASQLLTDITGESIEIGIEINQQVRSNRSIPDGQVIQRSFKVLIESKVGASTNIDQLLRHSTNFSNEDQKILLLLTKKPLEEDEADEIKRQISNRHPGVIFKSITFEDICKTAKTLFEDYEYEMRDLVDDYEEYCNDTGLFDQSRQLMRMVPCGTSLEINIRHGIYFCPSDRGYAKHLFIGLYKNKAVQAILKIDSVFDVEYKEKEDVLNKKPVEGRDTDEYDKKLVEIIRDAKRECGYNIAVGNRFFLGKIAETDYVKSSRGGMQSTKFENLREVIGDDFNQLSIEEIAQRLKGKQWE